MSTLTMLISVNKLKRLVGMIFNQIWVVGMIAFKWLFTVKILMFPVLFMTSY